jgi:hypothetical protein
MGTESLPWGRAGDGIDGKSLVPYSICIYFKESSLVSLILG